MLLKWLADVLAVTDLAEGGIASVHLKVIKDQIYVKFKYFITYLSAHSEVKQV